MTCPNSRVGSKSKMKNSTFERSRSDLSLGNNLVKLKNIGNYIAGDVDTISKYNRQSIWI